MDIRLTPGSYFSARGGYFHDRYSDTGIPQTTNYRYGAPATAAIGDSARAPGAQRLREHAARADHRLRHDQAQQHQRRLQPLLQRAGSALAARRLRLPARAERHQLVLPRRLRRSAVRPLVHLQRRHHRHRHLRLLRRQRPPHHQPGRQRHPLALRPGSVDAWQPPDAEPRHPHRRREHPGLPARGQRRLGDQVQHEGQAGASARRGLRRVGQRPHEGVRQLGPLLRLDQVRAAARLVRRRDLVHQLPRPRHARLRQPQPEQHAGQGSLGHSRHLPRSPLPGVESIPTSSR